MTSVPGSGASDHPPSLREKEGEEAWTWSTCSA